MGGLKQKLQEEAREGEVVRPWVQVKVNSRRGSAAGGKGAGIRAVSPVAGEQLDQRRRN